MLWTIIAILVIVWLLGLIFRIGGSIIHTVIVIAVILFIVNLLTGRRTV